MKPRTTLYGLLALLALGALLWLAIREPAQLVGSGRVTRGALEVSFVEEGKTRLKARYIVTAPVAGTLRRVTLQQGDTVRAGQVVAQIDPATSALLDPRSRSQARADVRAAESALASARQRIAAAQATHELARTELARHQVLAGAGAVARESLDQARARASTAAAALAAARADEQAAQQRVVAARAVLGDEGVAAGAMARVVTVTAPAEGRVLKRAVESSTAVTVGQVLMEIGDPARLEVEAEVLSTDAVRLSPGQTARLLRWGGEETLDAVISRVEPGGYTKVSALGVEEQRTRVILDFKAPRERWAALGDAYRVEVQFIEQQASDVLQVPASALFRAGDGWAVFKIEGGQARRTPVRVGLRSATAAQVLGGLAAGDVVVVQPDDRIHDGSRVKAN